jgi:type VI secretion system Hcp family effector
MAYPVFLNIEFEDAGELEGNAKDKRDWVEEGSIECLSYSGGVVNAAVGSAQDGGGEAALQPITISKALDATSPLLHTLCSKGELVKKAMFRFYKTKTGGTGTLAYTVEFSDARIQAVTQVSIDPGSGSKDVAMESIIFVTDKIVLLWEEGGIPGEHPPK